MIRMSKDRYITAMEIVPIVIGLTIPTLLNVFAYINYESMTLRRSLEIVFEYGFTFDALSSYYSYNLIPFIVVALNPFYSASKGLSKEELKLKWFGGFALASLSCIVINYQYWKIIMKGASSVGLSMFFFIYYPAITVPLTFLGIWLGKKVFYLLEKGNE